jgi:hypothetical protein
MFPPFFSRLSLGAAVLPSPDLTAVNHDFYGVRGLSGAPAQALSWLQNPLNNPPNPFTKQFLNVDPNRTYTLVVVNGALYWKVPQAVVAGDIMEQNPPFVNTNYDWLTYEVVLNKPKFRKTNQSRKVGLYAVEMKDMQVWLVDYLQQASIDAIAAAFFPDHTSAELELLAKRSWWWKQQTDLATLQGRQAPYRKLPTAVDAPLDALPALEPVTEEDVTGQHVSGARYGLKIHLPRYVVLPYNYWDNTSESRALGTNTTQRPIPLMQVNHGSNAADNACWDIWRTASRSCILRVNRVKPAGAPWALNNWTLWNFHEGDAERIRFKNRILGEDAPRFQNAAFKQEVGGPATFNLTTRTDSHFSMKTGVNYVGFGLQGKKDSIGIEDEWIVGCMRSDYMRQVEKLVSSHGPVPTDPLIQTEIMMLLERRVTGPGLEEASTDGVALREINVLDTTKVYFTPISIGFVGADMRTLTEEFANVDDAAWCSFWRKNWAEAIGKAKALLMVRYGIQHANPNVQNSLLEFNAGNPPTGPARVVIRDVADALLVREVAWALFGEDAPCPTAEDVSATLKRMSLPVLRFNFRTFAQCKANETGSTNIQFGTPGIQFLWHRFSAHYTARKPLKLLELPQPIRLKVLRLMATWMVAHSAAYVRTVEKALGTEFGAIRWDTLLSPAHDPERFMIPPAQLVDFQGSGEFDVSWEEGGARVIQDYLANVGRAAICAYHNRAWVDAPVVFEVKLVDMNDAPLPLTLLCYESTDHMLRGNRITDPDGKVPFYSKSFAEFTFQAGVRRYTGMGVGNWTLEKVDVAAVGPAVGNLTTLKLPAANRAVTVTPPGASLSGKAAAVQATVQADKAVASVQFAVDGVNAGVPVAANQSATIDTTGLVNGPHQVTAVATDDAAGTIHSPAVQVMVNNPLPTVNLTAPADGITILKAPVPVSADADPGTDMTLDRVEFQIDGNGFASIGAPGPYNATLDATNLTDGAHTITAIAWDKAGNQTPAQVTVTS